MCAWALLRGRRCLGLKFRREQIVGTFRADFYCPELRLVIEVDGSAHDDASAREDDRARAAALARRGLRVMRVRNEDVSQETFERLLRPLLDPPTQPPL